MTEQDSRFNSLYNRRMQRLKILLLGSARITLNGEIVATDRHKAIGLLAYLAVENKAHKRESLAALFWPDYPRESALSYLRRTLWELNKMLGKGWVEADRENVRLIRKPALEVDVEEFQRIYDQEPDQVEQLSKAVSLCRGDFLDGLVVADTAQFEEWQILQRETYRREYGRELERLVSALEEGNVYAQALAYAQRWLALDRLNESAYRAIMRQMAGLGDRSGVIHTYEACAKTLKDELGVPPEEKTTELYQAILHGKQAHLALEQKTPVGHLGKPEGNLPTSTTPFIAREEEIEQISKLALDPQVRLLTLTGPGGIGKTRLSIQVASMLDGTFIDGIWFIPLAEVQSVQGIIPAIAKCLRISFYKGEDLPKQQLLDYLREKRLILVLDNFEHLLEGGRELVADILGEAAEVKLLVTSRERLSLQSEQVYRVPGLRVPDLQTLINSSNPEEQAKAYSAIELLFDRARRVKPEFQITRENLKPVIEICQLVDGSPLGIELAAAWLEVLPEEEIAAEIVRTLDFLQSTAVDTPERQRSLRVVFDTSWKLLDAEEQQAFRRLCIFRGSFNRQAAQEVSGATLRTLLSLINKSWLEQTAEGRYHLHEVLKQYGMERLKANLDEWEETKNKQAEFYCTFLEVQGQCMLAEKQIQALQTLAPELDSNIPDTWEWLVSQSGIQQVISRMLPGLAHYWLIRGGTREDISLIKTALKAIPRSTERNLLLQRTILEIVEANRELSQSVFDDRPKERLEELLAKVEDYRLQDDLGLWYVMLVATYGEIINFQEAARRFSEMLPKMSQLPDSWDAGNFYLLIGWFTDVDQPDKREAFMLKSLEIFKKIGVLYEQGMALRFLGGLAESKMDYGQAIEYTLAAQSIYEQVGDMVGIDSTLMNLGQYYISLGQIDQAFHAFEELRHYREKMGNRRILGEDLSWESLNVSRFGNLDLALDLRQRSLDIAQEVGNQYDAAWATWELGEIYRLMGNVELASKYYQEARPSFERMQEFLGLGFYHRGLGDIAAMQGSWLEARNKYQEALTFHEREQRSIREWGLALTHARLGTALVRLGKLEEARQHQLTSLTLAVNRLTPDLKAISLLGIATWLLANGDRGRAAELAACVANQPTTWTEVKGQAGKILEEVKETLSPEEARLWEERGIRMKIDEACEKYGKEGSF